MRHIVLGVFEDAFSQVQPAALPSRRPNTGPETAPRIGRRPVKLAAGGDEAEDGGDDFDSAEALAADATRWGRDNDGALNFRNVQFYFRNLATSFNFPWMCRPCSSSPVSTSAVYSWRHRTACIVDALRSAALQLACRQHANRQLCRSNRSQLLCDGSLTYSLVTCRGRRRHQQQLQ